jgi:GT2 family glycosyltransferase
VVDNHSVDGSAEMVRQKFSDCICIENQENVGFSKANNQGIRIANGDYVLLLNPDTVVEEDTITKCLDYLDTNLKAGALGVKMIDGKGQYLPESKRGLPTPEVALYKMIGLNKLFPKSKRFGKYHMGFIGENQVAEVDVLAGAFMMLRKDVLDEVGLLDESFFMYGEDIDLSYRITQSGYTNIYFPETSIIHYKGESTRKMSVNYVFIFYRAMVIFAKKHYKGQNAALLVFLINMAIWGRALLAVVQRFVSKAWIFVADALILLIGLYFIKDYWEEHIKLFHTFPRELVLLHFPYYTFLWISSVYLSGGYQKPWSAKRLIRGVAIGTVIITAVYGLLPNHLRYSRGIILVGSLWAGISMLGLRIISHFYKYRNLDLGGGAVNNTVIVGEKIERERVLSLIQKGGLPINFLGFISISATDHEQRDVLGSLDRLEDMCEVYKVNEVIFCAKDVSSSETMKWMKLIGSRNIQFKIVPEERYFIIGSNSKDLNGELYTEEIHFSLNDEYNRRKKRLLDVIICIILLPIGLIISWFGQGFVVYYQRLLKVFWNRNTWVGYDSKATISHLPEIKDGIFAVSEENKHVSLNEQMRQKLNFLYAKNYQIDTDISVVFRNVWRK